jgi:NAD(P)H-hydrate epimerase
MIKGFFTDEGLSIPIVSANQMKEIDRIALEETGPNLFQMMENAGGNLAELVKRILQSEKRKKILVLAGTGGNGGGGLCAARHLSNWDFVVTVCLSEFERMKGVPMYQLHILNSTDIKIISIDELKNEKPDLTVDSIIGYNLSGEPNGSALEMINWLRGQLSVVVSLDVPSGINATSGAKSKTYVKPDLTLTLALPKSGLLPEVTGELFLCDIGIPASLYKRVGLVSPKSIFNKDRIIKLNQSK